MVAAHVITDKTAIYDIGLYSVHYAHIVGETNTCFRVILCIDRWGGPRRKGAGRKGQGCLVALAQGKGGKRGENRGAWKKAYEATKTAAPPFFSSSSSFSLSLQPYSTLSHTALIVQLLRALRVVLQWEVSGDVVSCFLTDSIHCSRCSSPSPGEPNRDQWGS